MKIPFAGPAYQARSLNADAQRCVNCYPELDNASPRAALALYGTPGTPLRFTLPTGPVRGSIKQGAYSYWVAEATVYRVDANYVIETLGVIGTAFGTVGMASNGTQVLIVDGVSGWLAVGAVLTEIADVDFPSGVTLATYLSSYFVVAGDGSGKFYWNETPNSGADWNGLDFSTAEGSPDETLGLIANQLELWVPGSNSTEIFVIVEDPDAPFARSGNTYIEHGCASGSTLAKLDNTVFWLGQDERGTGVVWRAEGYTPARISNHAIETAIQSYSTVSDAIAFTYQQGGHGFYVLTFPTAGKTWVYDVASLLWHERAWRDPGTNELTRWRPNTHCFVNGEHLVGDFEDGRVYALDLDVNTDDGDPILRLRATQCMDSDGGERVFYESLQVDMETGVGLSTGQGSDPQLMLRYSNDGGHTWSNIKTVSIGAVGEYGARAIFRRLGAGRNRVWEISLTDPVKFAVFGAYAKVTKGTS